MCMVVQRGRFIRMKVPKGKVECEPNSHKACPQKFYMTLKLSHFIFNKSCDT